MERVLSETVREMPSVELVQQQAASNAPSAPSPSPFAESIRLPKHVPFLDASSLSLDTERTDRSSSRETPSGRVWDDGDAEVWPEDQEAPSAERGRVFMPLAPTNRWRASPVVRI